MALTFGASIPLPKPPKNTAWFMARFYAVAKFDAQAAVPS